MDYLAKVFEKLGVTQLDESAKTEVQKFLAEAIELKAKEKAKELSEEVLKEEKAKLEEKYDGIFAEYKDEMLSKWSDFVDDVIAEEVKLPDNVVKFAALGEKYQPIMEQIRMMLAIDEGTVESEAQKLLGEAKTEIEKLRSQVNKLIAENMEIKEDAKAMAVHIHLRKKCDGLTEAQKKTVMDMLGDLTDRKQIDEKFDFVVENFLMIEKKKTEKKEEEDGDKEPDGDKDDKDCDCKDEDKKDKKDKKGKKKDKEDADDLKEKGITETETIPSTWEAMLEQYSVLAKKPL